MKNLITILTLSILAVSCGKPVSIKFKPKVQSNKQAMQARTDLEVTQKETVTFTRKKQMTNHYDCHGNLTNRKIETTNNLTKRLKVKYENTKDIFMFEAKNPRTNQSIGLSSSRGSFTIDYSPTVFFLQVKQGINNIEYAFYSCSQIVKDSRGFRACGVPLTLEKEGIIQVDVIYDSIEIPGERDIHWTGNCQK